MTASVPSTMQPMPPIPTEVSIAGAGYKAVTEWRNSSGSTIARTFKEITSEFAYAGLMIFSGIEVLARIVQLAYTKIVANSLSDAAEKKAYIKKYLIPHGQNVLMCAAVTSATFWTLKDNLTEQAIDGKKLLDDEMLGLMTTHKGLLNSLGFQIP